MGSGRCITEECQRRSCYKWLILLAGCATMFLRAIFINGTLPVLSIYYEEKFSDRKISSMIGSIQTSMSFVACFPAMLICRRIGAGQIQIIGGVLSCVGMTCTAFSQAAWQALLANGFLTGLGGACLYAGCYNAVSGYFTGHQLAPFVAMATSFSLGSLATPQIIKAMIASLGFRDCLLTSGGMMLLNIATGIIYRQPIKTDSHESMAPTNNRKISLKIQGGKSGIFHTPSELDMYTNTRTIDTKKADVTKVSQENDKSEKFCEDDSVSISSSEDSDSKTCEEKDQKRKSKLRSLLAKVQENKMAINYLLAAFCAYAGHVAYLGNLGDYAKYALGFSDEIYTTGITILGSARLISGLLYIVLARHVVLSSLCMYAVNVALQAMVVFSLMTRPDKIAFYVLLGLIGVFQSLFSSAMYGSCIEVTSPAKAPYMFMIQTLFDGCGSVVAPYITAYLQVEVDVDAGLYFAGAIMIFSSLILSPSAIISLRTPKIYTAEESVVSDKLYQTSYVPRPL